MATTWIREFTGGLDTRKLPETSAGGTLIRARDGHITRGGEFEQRADFVEVYELPSGLTKGLAATPDGLTVFGHQAEPAGIPSGVSYQRLQHPSAEALDDVKVTTLFKAKLQVLGQFTTGETYLFFDGARVTDTNAPPNLADSGVPEALLTQTEKVYVGSGPNLFYSGVADSTDFGDGVAVGAGFEDMSTHAEGSERITALAPYDSLAAIFARRVIQIWSLDPDPTLNRRVQTLSNTGAISTRSVTQFGDGDVFYLDRSGIRSLRSRDSSNSARTTDVGSAIDTLVSDLIEEITETEAANAIGLIEPRDGRFWMIVGNRVFVFSYFTGSKVSAWTEYLPGFTISHAVVFNDRVWVRSGDTVYVYGGTGETFSYSDNVGEAWLPYLDGDDPSRAKHLKGVDAAVRGTWQLNLAMDPNSEAVSDPVARIDKTTFGGERIDYEADFNHASLRFKVVAPLSATRPAKLASAVLHYQSDAEEDS